MPTTIAVLDKKHKKLKSVPAAHTVYVYQKHASDEGSAIRVLSTGVSRELFRARGNWLFDFIPDELIITEKIITIRNNYFPFGNFVSSISIENIHVVEISHSLIFSTLYIKGSPSNGINMKFKWLTKRAAQKAKDIIDGLRIVQRNDITVPSTSKQELVNTLAEIGQND